MNIRTAISRFFQKRKIKSNLKVAKTKQLNIGAGPDGESIEYKGWESVDIEILDITKEEQWMDLLGKKDVLDNILAEHVWEHLTDEHTELANKNCFAFLKPGGRLRIAVPDGLHKDESYVNQVKPGGFGVGSDDHKILYTHEIMQKRLEMAGFSVVKVEYFDNLGVFHREEFEENHGYIKRSFLRDKRNVEGKIRYTSLIVDAIKQLK
jgi:predicted SAM-dependent methyltransferase